MQQGNARQINARIGQIQTGYNSHMRQFSKSMRLALQRLTLVSLIGVISLISIAHAQTEYTISSNNPNLEAEYRAELDKWMLRAYEGDRDAQFKVGILFTNDQFNEPDYEQAVYWYKQAARQEHVLAQYNLGHQYLTGVGVKANTETAMQWWLKAAKNNHPLAQFNIGRAYYLGIGLKEDHDEARKWFTNAANNQEPKSIDILEQLGWAGPGEFTKTSIASNSIVDDNEQVRPNIESSANDNEDTQTDAQLVSRITPAPTATSESVIALQDAIQEPTQKPIGTNVDTVITSPAATDTPTEAVIDIAESTDNTVTAETRELETASNTNNNTEKQTAPTNDTLTSSNNPIALYTDPNIRSVLITIIDNKDDLEILKVGPKWIRVRLERGFPIWVHEDYIIASDGVGTITGSAVNARSVPIVTNGTIVGKLRKNESIEIIDKNNDWYRIVSPARFKAWVKVNDFNRQPYASTVAASSGANSSSSSTDKTRPLDQNIKWGTASKPEPIKRAVKPSQPKARINGINDNEWLFSQPSDNYTLQLASFNEPEKIAEFVARDKFINNPDLHRFTSKGKNDVVWTYFLYGQYTDTELAKAARTEIKQKRAWIRNFGKLQQNRCVAWKRQLPPPKELNMYCVN